MIATSSPAPLVHHAHNSLTARSNGDVLHDDALLPGFALQLRHRVDLLVEQSHQPRMLLPRAVDKEHATFVLKLARVSFNLLELVSRAFTLRHADPHAHVEIHFRYSLFDPPFTG